MPTCPSWTLSRTHDEVTELLTRARTANPTDEVVDAALAALTWLAGETDVAPVTRTRRPATAPRALHEEYAACAAAADGFGEVPTSQARAAATDRLLWWALGQCSPPSWLQHPAVPRGREATGAQPRTTS